MGLTNSKVTIEDLRTENNALKYRLQTSNIQLENTEDSLKKWRVACVVGILTVGVAAGLGGYMYATKHALGNQKVALIEKYSKELAQIKRRANSESIESKKFALTKISKDLLPVCDYLEMAIKNASKGAEIPVIESENSASVPQKGTSFSALLEGVNLTHAELLKTLGKHEIVPIEAVGTKFDPHLHEAKLLVPPPEGELSGNVAEEIRKGYRINDRVLRASEVIVYS